MIENTSPCFYPSYNHPSTFSFRSQAFAKNRLRSAKNSLDKKNLATSQESSATFWYEKALLLYEKGIKNQQISFLRLANKSFKQAVLLDPTFVEAFFFWGSLLVDLAEKTGEAHYINSAYEKYLRAKDLAHDVSAAFLAALYADLGSVETLLAEKSGEAIDIRSAIHSFRLSLRYQNNPSAPFWNAFGKAYYQMGLFIQDNRYYLQAIGHLEKAVQLQPHFYPAWLTMAFAYKELYINTASEEYAKKASACYQKSCAYDDLNEEVWLEWAHILHESGKASLDPKKIRLAIEKCVKAHSLTPNDPRIIAQWVESLSLLGTLSSRHDLLLEAEHKILKATTRFPEVADLWYAYAICLGSQAEYYEDPAFYDFAIEKIQEGLSIDSSIAELWHILAVYHNKLGVHFSDQKLLQLADKFFVKTLDLKPSCPVILFDRAHNQYALAELLESASYAKTACEQLEELFQTQKKALLHHPEWLFYYGSCLYLLGDISANEGFLMRSIEVLWQVLLIEPEYPEIHQKIANCFSGLADFSYSSSLYEKAFYYFQMAASQDPENQDVWLEWGLSLIHSAHQSYTAEKTEKLYTEAEKKIRKAGELGCEHAYYHLACLHSLRNEFSQAMHLLEMAKDRDCLPPTVEIMSDDWLEGLRKTSGFSQFLSKLIQKEQMQDLH